MLVVVEVVLFAIWTRRRSTTTGRVAWIGFAVAIVLPITGLCVGAGDFATCVDEHGTCRFCRMLNAMDALVRPCDLYDDGVGNGSCPPP